MPVDRWPGTDNPARPQLLRAARARARRFRRVVGAWGNEDLIENAFDLQRVRRRRACSRSARCGSASTTVPHFTETFAIDVASTNGGGRITYGADCRPNEELVEFARGTDLLMRRGDAAAPRAHRACAATSRPREAGEHAPPRGRQARRAHPHLRRARRALGPRRGARRRSAARSRSPREGAVYDALSRRPSGPRGRSPANLRAMPPSATCSRTSSACGARSTSCSATSSSAPASRRGARGFSPARRRLLRGDPPRGGGQGRPRRRRPRRLAPRDPRPRAGDHRPAPAARRRGPRLPADRDRARAVPARRSQLGADVDADAAQATYEDGILRVELPLVAAAERAARRCRSRCRRAPTTIGRATP